MAKLHGLKDMSAEPVKSKAGEESAPVVKQHKEKTAKKPSQYRTGYGRYTTTVIMKNGDGFVKVLRNDVEKRLASGWATVPRQQYKKAIAEGATPAVSEVKVKTKKK
jgi:hypothetical protein